MRQKGILQLSSNVGFFGAENVIFELAKELSRMDYQPVVGVFRNTQNPHVELAEVTQKHNIEAKVFDCNGRFDLRTIFSIKDFVKRNNIRIIHSHGYKTNMYALLAGQSENVPLIATCHPWITPTFKMKMYAWLDKIWLNRFDKIVAISDEVRMKILGRGVDETKVLIIDNGIDIRRFGKNFDINPIRQEFNIKPEAQVIGTIGRLSEEKGHALFINAAKMLLDDFANLFFIIVGDGPFREKLQKQAVELGLQNHLLFTGICNDIPKILALMDIFVLPSLTEGLPMVLLEAMAAKKPIIATNVGDIPRVIQQNETGLLVRPNDVYGLKEAITTLLNHKDKAVSLAQKAYSKVAQDFSSECMARKYLEIYEDLLEKYSYRKG